MNIKFLTEWAAVSMTAVLLLADCSREPPSVAQPKIAPPTSVPAVAVDTLRERARVLFQPIPQEAPALPGNPASPEKVALGKMLYFDPRLSASHSISCASCHNLSLGGTDIASTSLGHRWQKGGRNSPTVLNAVFNTAQFWDGRAKDLQEQAAGPLANPVEMASPKGHAVEQLKGIPGYKRFFASAFPDEADPITLENIQRAIAVFEATLLTPDSPFDRYLKGQVDALSEGEKAGLAAFMDRGCAGCHNGINVGGGMYAPFGLVEKPGKKLLPAQDKGRFAVTKNADDRYVYKVPSLRNIALTPPYFHTGEVWDLQEAISVMGTTQLGTELTPKDIDEIAAFLNALTGIQPQVTLPILPPSVASTPRPQP